VDSDYDFAVRRIARVLSDIASALATVDDVHESVCQVLERMRELVPYARCALFKVLPGSESQLFTVPPPSEAMRPALVADLHRLFRLVSQGEPAEGGLRRDGYVTLPVMGLDQVIGVLDLQPPPDVAYNANHLRLLAIVIAQLGSYFTLLKLREDEARRARELKAANEFQQRLAGIVGHDLRTPLSVIMTVASTLALTSEDKQVAQAMERTLRNAHKANRIIGDLMDVSLARATGQLPIHRQRADLRALIAEVLEDIRVAHKGRTIKLQILRNRIEGQWDPGRVAQVVTNLVNNAVQHGDSNAPVTVTLRTRGSEALIEVHNRGPEIPARFLSVLFDPFVQGHQERRARSRSGLGLGLYIVDQIVRAHGGSVAACSRASEGTTFSVALPLLAADLAAVPTTPESHAQGPQAPLVMIVEDDTDTLLDISEILQNEGYAVTTASNGREALDLLRNGVRPKVILTDLVMPVMDGERLCAVCHEDPALSGIPIFIISGDGAAAARARRSGATGFLPKPLQSDKLVRTIGRISH
jgi:signal transduction histidine kinase/CheY-like chemotaxis protein